MHSVYIVYSASSDLYYVGQSSDVDQRMVFHNHLNEGGFTSKHRPWMLKKVIPTDNEGMAIRMERYIKRRKSRKYIERLINDPGSVEKLRKRFG